MSITSKSVDLKDGRMLGSAEYGGPVRKSVFHFNGSAYARLGRPTDETILTDRV